MPEVMVAIFHFGLLIFQIFVPDWPLVLGQS